MTLLAQLNPAHDAPTRQAVMRYDDGTFVRIDRRGIVQGRKPLQAAKVDALIAGGTATIIAQQVEQASYDTRRAVWCAGRGERHVWASERTLCEEVTK